MRDGARLVMPREVAFSELGIDAPPFGDVDDEDDANERLAVLFAQASAAERRAIFAALQYFDRGEPLPPTVRKALSRLRRRVLKSAP